MTLQEAGCGGGAASSRGVLRWAPRKCPLHPPDQREEHFNAGDCHGRHVSLHQIQHRGVTFMISGEIPEQTLDKFLEIKETTLVPSSNSRWSGRSHTSFWRWSSRCECTAPMLHMRSSLAICRDPHTGTPRGTGPGLRWILNWNVWAGNCPVDVRNGLVTKTSFLSLPVSIMASFPGLGSQMGRSVGAQLWGCAAEWLQIWLLSPQEHNDAFPVRFPNFHIQLVSSAF